MQNKKISGLDDKKDYTVYKVLIVAAVIILIIAVVAVATFMLQGEPIKSPLDAINYLESNSYWTYFKPEISAVRETDAPIEIDGKRYYVTYFTDDETSPEKTYTYYVDSKAKVYSMDKDGKLVKLDKYNQNILPENRETLKIKHVYDANDYLFDMGYVDMKTLAEDLRFAPSKIIDDVFYYHIAALYPDRLDEFFVSNNADVYIKNASGEMVKAEPIVKPVLSPEKE